MGVTGLWQLISPVGRPIPLETLENKILAIDISIWLNQAVKGFRDAQGRAQPNAHLLGLFHRVCKLLFYKIKPVFVFDGAVPLLKMQTLESRRQNRQAAINSAEKSAQEILTNLMARELVMEASGSSPQKNKSKSISPRKGKKNQTTKVDPTEDIFWLPPLPESSTGNAKDTNESQPSGSAEREPSVFDSILVSEFQNLAEVDIESEEFNALPPDIRHEILSEMKEQKRQQQYKQNNMPRESHTFSEYQMTRLLKRRQLTKKINEVAKEMHSHAAGELLSHLEGEEVAEMRKIASEDTAHTILIQTSNIKKVIAKLDKQMVGNKLAEPGTNLDKNISSTIQSKNSSSVCNIKYPNTLPLVIDEMEKVENQTALQKTLQETELAANIKKNHSSIETFKSPHISVDKFDTVENNIALQRILEESIPLRTNSKSVTEPLNRCSPSNVDIETNISANPNYHLSQENYDIVEIDSPPLFLAEDFQPLNPSINLNQSDDEFIIDDSSDSDVECLDESKKIVHSAVSKLHTFEDTCNIKEPKIQSKPLTIVLEVDKVPSVEDELFPIEVFKPNISDIKIPPLQEVKDKVIVTPSVSVSVGTGIQSPTKSTLIQDFFDKKISPTKMKMKELKSPFKGVISPSKRVSSPSNVISSPSKVVSSPSKGVSSPFKVVSSPSKVVSSPSKVVSSPSKVVSSPSKVVSSPSKGVSSPFKGVSSPFKGVSSPSKVVSSPSKGVSSPFKRVTSPSNKVNSPSKEVNFASKDNKSSSDISISPAEENVSESVSALFNNMSEQNLSDLREEMDLERLELIRDQRKKERQAQTVSNQVYFESQELLKLFGVPFIVSPTEAEAQCAKLELLGLTHGTITDDSDIWLFGGSKVYKNFFTQGKFLECYCLTDIQNHFGLDRSQLICFALLTGSDYTEGIEGVGPVRAMEVISEFKEEEGFQTLKTFRDWWHLCHNSAQKPGNKVRAKLLNLELPESFPVLQVYQAYIEPQVDDSKEKFSWGLPNLDELRELAKEKFGWDKSKVDAMLLPVLKKVNERESQTRIDSFFQTSYRKDKNLFPSKRIQNALTKIRPSTSSINPDDPPSTSNNSKVKRNVVKRKAVATKAGKRVKKINLEINLSEDSSDSCEKIS